MGDRKIEEWIEKKLEEDGVSPERLKKVLDEKGYDPEAVNEVVHNGQEGEELNTEYSSDKNSEDFENVDLGNISKDESKHVEKESSEGDEGSEIQAGEHRDRLKELTTDVEKGLSQNWKPGLEVVLVMVLLASTVIFLPSIIDGSEGLINDFNSAVEDFNAEKEQPTSSPESSNSSASVPEAEVVLTDSAQPSELEISSNENVKFINNAGTELEFKFERNIKDFTLESEESRVVDINANVYYTAKSNVSENEIYGSVNVK